MQGNAMNKLKIEAKVENLPEVLAFTDALLEAAGCPMRPQTQIDVAVEEIFVNIARYAYPGETGEAVITIEILSDPAAVKITFADGGIPYDPLAKEDPDITLSAEERPIGGLGIYMVKKTMDEVSYKYKDGQNAFTMIKKF